MRRFVAHMILVGVLIGAGAWGDDTEARIDSVFEKFAQPGSPGLAITVMQGGDIVFEKGYGLAQLEYGIPITPQTVFHVASVSKQFTTFAVVLLAQEGKLSLDDDIRTHLPEFPDLGHEITIRHLILHTSGIRDQWSLLIAAGWRFEDVITREDILKLLYVQKELNFPPGDAFLYSNAGYTLLGEIVANVSGQSLKDFTAERIFEPLDMTRTHFHDDHRHVVPDRAYSYGELEEGGFEKIVLSYANVGATSLFTTGSDLMKWQRNFTSGQVGGKAATETMLERGSLNDGRATPYGFALSHGTYKGLRTIAHGGADAGFRSYLVRFPDHDLSIALTGNLAQIGSGNLSFKVAEIFLEEALAESSAPQKIANNAVQVNEDVLESYKGTYLYEEGNLIYKLLQKDGVLKIARGTSTPIALTANSETRFSDGVGDSALVVQIESRSKKGVDEIIVTTGDTFRRTFRRVDRPERSPEYLEPFAGRYYSSEIDAFYDVTFDGRHLHMERRKSGHITLQPLFRDGFNWGGDTVRFVRDKRGNISGFRYNSGRILNLWFEKTN